MFTLFDGDIQMGVLNNLKIFTQEDDTDLYILDSNNQRIVVVGKDGEYKAQYQNEKFARATDFVVDVKGGKAWVLIENGIWEFGL
jgi:homoserine trans-succinylase